MTNTITNTNHTTNNKYTTNNNDDNDSDNDNDKPLGASAKAPPERAADDAARSAASLESQIPQDPMGSHEYVLY